MTSQQPISHGMRTFIIVWFGQLVSTVGSGLTGFALGVWIYERTGSATLFVINLLVWNVPQVLLAPVAGWASDRFDRRLVMIATDSLAGLGTLFVAVMLATGHLAIWNIYLAQFLFSLANTFQWPAQAAATSLMVPKEHLGRAGGMSGIGYALSTLASPGLAGFLYVTVGLWAVFLIDVVTYLVALGTLLAVRFPQPEPAEAAEGGYGSFFQEAFYGWGYIRARVGLLALLVVFALMNFTITTTLSLLTPMLLEITTPDAAGYVNSAFGVGLLVGTLVMSAWGGPKRRVYGIFFSELVLGLGLILMGITPSLIFIAFAQAVGAVGGALSQACSNAIWQSKVAPDVQGRVFAIRSMMAFAITPVATFLAGPLAEAVFEPAMAEGGALAASVGSFIGAGPGRGIGLMFALGGMIYVALALALVAHPRIRRLEIELPDAIPAAPPTG